MRVLVTGSAGHLGEALMRLLPGAGHRPVGLDLTPGPFTHVTGSAADPGAVARAIDGADAVIHTATLHKPHIATHTRQDFIDTNVTGTLTLLEAAARRGIRRFVFTSTTSAFGAALSPGPGEPAAWIDEAVTPVPKNIYGVTKTAAEDLAALFAARHGLGCVVLRTARFFPEADDSPAVRAAFTDENAKANEYLFRRVDLEDAATAHLAALDRAETIGFARYVIAATTPFTRADWEGLSSDPTAIVARCHPDQPAIYASRGYSLPDRIGRVYDNARARAELGWRPAYDFARILAQLNEGAPIGSALARAVGSKGYHAETFADGPYPVD